LKLILLLILGLSWIQDVVTSRYPEPPYFFHFNRIVEKSQILFHHLHQIDMDILPLFLWISNKDIFYDFISAFSASGSGSDNGLNTMLFPIMLPPLFCRL